MKQWFMVIISRSGPIKMIFETPSREFRNGLTNSQTFNPTLNCFIYKGQNLNCPCLLVGFSFLSYLFITFHRIQHLNHSQ